MATNTKVETKEWFEILVILIACIAAFNRGLFYSWPSPFLLKIAEDNANYNITEEQASFFAVISSIGIIILPPFLAPLANSIGRKKTILLTVIPYLTSWITKAVATNLWLLYFARFCVGVGDVITLTCLPIYIGETATPKVRGLWGNAYSVTAFFGQFLVNVLGIYFSVQLCSLVGILASILFLITFPLMPEFPYYYITKGDDLRAKQSLMELRRTDNVEVELQMIKVANKKQMAECGSWKSLLIVKSNRKALLIGTFLRVSQIFSGVHVFASYAHFIFTKAGTDISAEMSTIIFSGLNVLTYVCACYVSEKLGRRLSLMVSLITSGIVLTAEGFYFLIETNSPSVDLTSVQWFPLMGMTIFLFTSFGIGIIPNLMQSELFSASIKSKAVAGVVVIFGITGFLANNIFYYLNNYTGLSGPFFLFASCNFASSIITYYIVPETKGKTLEEIQQHLI